MSNNKRVADVDAIVATMRSELGLPATRGVDAPSIDEVLRRVKVEIANRRKAVSADAALSESDGGTGDFIRWHRKGAAFVLKSEYALGDFLKFDDADFVDVAYRGVLRRPADPNGFNHRLSEMRKGHMTKVEVLASLRWSPEGVARGVHVDGLLLPYKLQQLRRIWLLGPLFEWVHSLLRLPTLLRRQDAALASRAQETQALGAIINELAEQVEASLTTLRKELDDLRDLLPGLAKAGDLVAAESRIHALDVSLRGATTKLDGVSLVASALASEVAGPLASRLDGLDELLGNASSNLREVTAQISDLQSLSSGVLEFNERQSLRTQEISLAVSQLEQDSQAALRAVSKLEQESEAAQRIEREAIEDSERKAHLLDPLYAAFESRFRGSEELVRARVEEYLPRVMALGPRATLADLGSGRGEWLHLLAENGVSAMGVDTNQVFLAECRRRNLDVAEDDAISWLSKQPDASRSAITSMHLVEHLPIDQLVTLVQQAFRVIHPGGLLVLETPNPENLLVASHWFYLDPTHRNPLPPAMLHWLVQASGFESIEVQRLTRARDVMPPDLLDSQMPSAKPLNMLIGSLSAAPDYAIIARRP